MVMPRLLQQVPRELTAVKTGLFVFVVIYIVHLGKFNNTMGMHLKGGACPAYRTGKLPTNAGLFDQRHLHVFEGGM
jgi:hypothetical protein